VTAQMAGSTPAGIAFDEGLEPPMLAIGADAPRFDGLLGVDGRRYGLDTFADRRLVVLIFSSNRCPTVKAYEPRLRAFQDQYGPDGVQLVAINSSDPHLYPDESFPRMVERAAEGGYTFPYLADPGQHVGWAYGAQRTFQLFLLDAGRRLRYEGRFDDSRLAELVTSHDLVDAVEDLLTGRDVRTERTRAFGCSLDYLAESRA